LRGRGKYMLHSKNSNRIPSIPITSPYPFSLPSDGSDTPHQTPLWRRRPHRHCHPSRGSWRRCFRPATNHWNWLRGPRWFSASVAAIGRVKFPTPRHLDRHPTQGRQDDLILPYSFDDLKKAGRSCKSCAILAEVSQFCPRSRNACHPPCSSPPRPN